MALLLSLSPSPLPQPTVVLSLLRAGAVRVDHLPQRMPPLRSTSASTLSPEHGLSSPHARGQPTAPFGGNSEAAGGIFATSMASLRHASRPFAGMVRAWSGTRLSSSGAVDLQVVEQLHTEADALVRYVQLNLEGLRKIVKKFDKQMGTSHLQSFTANRITRLSMAHSNAPRRLLGRVQALVSRDKLLEVKIQR